jgi:Na+/glutamate symporter
MARADGGHVGLVADCMAVAAGAGFGEAEVDHRAQGQRGRDGLDVLTLNLCLAGVAVGVGALLKQILMQISPLFDAVPVFPLAMVGGLLVQLLLQKLNQPFLASASDQASIASLSMDVLITAAMASLNLPLLADNLLPFTVLAVVGLVWNVLMVLLLAPRLFPDAWFERAIADFGQATGSTANGLLLLRMADPTGRSQVLEAFSFKQLLFEPFLGGGLITAFAPWRSAAWGWDAGQRCAWHSPSAPWWWACACSERCAAGAKARGRDREDSAA